MSKRKLLSTFLILTLLMGLVSPLSHVFGVEEEVVEPEEITETIEPEVLDEVILFEQDVEEEPDEEAPVEEPEEPAEEIVEEPEGEEAPPDEEMDEEPIEEIEGEEPTEEIDKEEQLVEVEELEKAEEKAAEEEVLEVEEPKAITVSAMESTFDLNGTIEWHDFNDIDGVRPDSDELGLELYADGVLVNATPIWKDLDTNKWIFQYPNMPVFNDEDVEIDYTAKITDTTNGYSYTINYVHSEAVFIGRATYVPSNENLVFDDIDGSLYFVRRSTEPKVFYVWTEFELTEAQRALFMQEYEPLARSIAPEMQIGSDTVRWISGAGKNDGLELKLVDGKWVAEYEAPKYWTQVIYGGFTATITGIEIEAQYNPLISIPVVKIWDDNENQDGVRPDEVSIILYVDGDPSDYILTLSDANDWRGSFINLEKYDENGRKITYSIAEEFEDEDENYDTEITWDDEDGYIVTNKHIPETITIEGKKTWDDDDNRDGIRPTEIKIIIGGSENDQHVSVIELTITEADGWAWKVENLPKYVQGREITYTVSEEPIPGYESIVEGYNITNKHAPELITIMGEKTWDDNDDQDGLRPVKISVTLKGTILKEGNEVEVYTETKEVTEADGWSWEFKELYKYDSGEEITYKISEEQVEGYEPPVVDGYNITNKHVPEVITIEGKKTWDDDNDRDGIRPKEIKIIISGSENDQHVSVNELTITEADGWAWKVENLPKYVQGRKITYTVSEEPITGYEATVDGYNITNKHVPERIEVKAEKIWVDGKLLQPKEVKFQLYADGEKLGEPVAVKAPDWSYTWKDLYKKNAGKDIVYEVKEVEIPKGFEVSYEKDGYSTKVINTYIIPKVDITAKKVWEAAPEKKPTIWFKLYRQIKDGKPEAVPGAEIMELKDISEVKWMNLDKTDKDGHEYIFLVKEVDKDGKDFVPENYEKKEDGLTVKNTFIKKDPPKKPLPPTGQTSTPLFVVIGVLLLLGSLVLLKKTRKV